jgi:hypothetical protein
VLAAGVLGVFVFCGIVVAATGGGDKPAETKDVARNGALAPTTTAAAPADAAAPTTAAPGSGAAEVPPLTMTPPAATTAPAPPVTTAPAPGKTTQTKKPPTTKPPAAKPPTKPPAQNCNPNYTPCVPNDPVDVDCAGGSGNGPSYVQGPVRVIGSDPYGLDTDHDGIGCE